MSAQFEVKDTISHSNVVRALSSSGIGGQLLSWFSDYLLDRQQFVCLNGASSDPARVTSGVPQGSILGPLLFLLAFNSIFQVPLSDHTNMTGYADDITYTKVVASPDDLSSLDSDLASINAWFGQQQLRLNLNKVKCMVISRWKTPPSPDIYISGQSIERVSSFKLLGVTITPSLSWQPHISHVCSQAKKTIGFLYRLFGGSTTRCFSRLYKSLVLPILDYSWTVSGILHSLPTSVRWNVSRISQPELPLAPGLPTPLPSRPDWAGPLWPQGDISRSYVSVGGSSQGSLSFQTQFSSPTLDLGNCT